MTDMELDQHLQCLFGLVPAIQWAKPSYPTWAPRLNDTHIIAPGVSNEQVAQAWHEQFGPQRFDYTDGMPWCSTCQGFFLATNDLHVISPRHWLCDVCHDNHRLPGHTPLAYRRAYRDWGAGNASPAQVRMETRTVCACGDLTCLLWTEGQL